MGTLTASNLRYDSAGTELKVSGTFAFGTAYNNTGNDSTTGETITAAALGMSLIKRIKLQPEKGYDFECLGLGDGGGVSTVRIKAYFAGAAGGTSGAEASHTHAVALDSGTSGAGDAHTHAFTGTAIGADTFTMKHDAMPETNVLYVSTADGVIGFFESDCSADNASDYFTTAGSDKVLVRDSNGTLHGPMSYQVYFNASAAAGQRLCINNTISASDIFVRTVGGKVIKILHDAAAATYAPVYFDDDAADKSLALNATLGGATNITDNATSTTYKGLVSVCSGSNANESTHTHGPGTLADVASGAGSSHTHSISASAGGEVTNGTNLYSAGLTAVEFEAYGY